MKKIEFDWTYLDGFVDPPPPPEGYIIELKYSAHLGFPYAYRFVREFND